MTAPDLSDGPARQPDVIHRGEGPYPHPCDFCGQPIGAGEPYVLTVEGGVFHEVCDFFRREG